MTCSSSTISRTRRLAASALITLALVAGPARGGDPADALAKARAAIDRGDGIAAEAPLRDAIRSGAPADALRAMLGEALIAQGNRREARKVLWEGGFTPETTAAGWQLRGRIELADGRLPAAAHAFDQALRLNGDNAGLWVDIGRLRYGGGEQAQAIAAAERAVRLDPRNVRALELRGVLVREQFGLVAALPWFEAGLRIKPSDAGLLGEYAATLGEMGQYRAMLVVCRKLVQVDPGNVRALYLQAVLVARAGQTDLARAILLKTGSALRDMPAAVLLNGLLEYRAGNINLAIGHFDRLVRAQPDNLQAQQMLARALARQKLDRQLAERMEPLARQSWASPYLLSLVGQGLRRMGQDDRAASYLQRSAQRGTRSAQALAADLPLGALALRYGEAPNFAGAAVPYIRGLLGAGQASQALAVAERLRGANSGAAEAHLLAGDVRMVLDDPRGALSDYRQAAAIRFNEPVLRRIDAALRQSGASAEADAMTARYLRQNPGNPAALQLLAAGRARNGNADGAEALARIQRQRGLLPPT